MFSKKNLQNIATIFLIFITLFSTLTNKSLAQNATVYNGVRDTVNEENKYGCNEKDTEDEEGKTFVPEKTCYTSKYDEDRGICDNGDLKFDPYGDNVDKFWNFGNASCLGYIYGAGLALQGAFIGCDILCPWGSGSSEVADVVEVVAKEPKDALAELTKTAFQKGLESGAASAASAATAATSAATQVGSAAVTTTLATVTGMPLDPFVLLQLARYGAICGSSYLNPAGAACCAALGACGFATSVALLALTSIWDIAKDNFENTTICGSGWKGWKRETEKGTTLGRWKIVDGNYAICLKRIFRPAGSIYCDPGKNGNDNSKCRKTIKQPKCDSNSIKNKSQERYCEFLNESGYGANIECTKSNISIEKAVPDATNLHYREYMFEGIEYVDNGSDACKNPIKAENINKWKGTLGYDPTDDNGHQRYYFKGPNQRPNFACSRFLGDDPNDLDALKAFTCCQKHSQKTICLEKYVNRNGNDHQFCIRGEECSTNLNVGRGVSLPIKYKISESEVSKDYICAKTYTVCPYDHNLQGGTDKAQHYYYNPKILSNFCQYMSHCIKLPPVSENSYFDPKTFFFAESCKDLRGDSQFFNENEIGRISRFSSLYSRNFSAPMVQCFKETLENNFMQKTGKTICVDANEVPKKTKANPDGACTSGYVQKKGQVINQTFFAKVQNRFLIPIKIALVLSVVMFGFNILLATPEAYINKKTVMTYLVKFGLIYFFVIGNAWQGFFMDSVMNVSSEFADITFNPKSTKDASSDGDGCNFPKYNYSLLLLSSLEESVEEGDDRNNKIAKIKTGTSYPPGKNYLRIWDTFDCKIARAIGYAPDVSVPNLLKMIFAGFLSGGLGIMFFFAAFSYALMLFSIAMRAIHITIMSIMGVILLIYVSPLTITCALFERTKGIFENWWKQMLGFILQPMILFAYLGLMLTVFDDLFIGDAKFNPPVKGELPTINCDPDTTRITNPDENSIYCILRLNKYENFTGLEIFDLAIPVLQSMNKEKINTLTKAAIIMFVFLKFLDTITLVAKKLVGGVELKAEPTSDIQNLLKKVAKGVQKRALNTTKKLVTKAIPDSAKKKLRSEDKPFPKIDNNDTNNSSSAGGDKDS